MPLNQRSFCQQSSGSRTNRQASQQNKRAWWVVGTLPFPGETTAEHLNPGPARRPTTREPCYSHPQESSCAMCSACAEVLFSCGPSMPLSLLLTQRRVLLLVSAKQALEVERLLLFLKVSDLFPISNAPCNGSLPNKLQKFQA